MEQLNNSKNILGSVAGARAGLITAGTFSITVEPEPWTFGFTGSAAANVRY